ncbi:MAG: phosphotransferase [Clostridiales bacterium]|nr:phosphotransferase [Clostridiales bacterium]
MNIRKEDLKGISGYETFVGLTHIPKGWSHEEKWHVKTGKGEELLLRVGEIRDYERIMQSFYLMRRGYEKGMAISKPICMGLWGQGKVYTLLKWCTGQEGEEALPYFDQQQQYRLGLEAGKQLQILHGLPCEPPKETWSDYFSRKTDRRLEAYLRCGLRFQGDQQCIAYIQENRTLLHQRPWRWQHGDYHLSNMVISPTGKVQIIDFNRCDQGDPWEEFNRLVWSAGISPAFATGQVTGYFDGAPPKEFFPILALYMASNALGAIAWAIGYGKEQVEVMMEQSRQVVNWFDNMNKVVPSWFSPLERDKRIEDI